MTGKFPHKKVINTPPPPLGSEDENVPVDPSVDDTTHVPQPHNMAEPGVKQGYPPCKPTGATQV
ncbi:hypothetical protein BDQ17DRAFT_1378811, partial [Cyathus striatus]